MITTFVFPVSMKRYDDSGKYLVGPILWFGSGGQKKSLVLIQDDTIAHCIDIVSTK